MPSILDISGKHQGITPLRDGPTDQVLILRECGGQPEDKDDWGEQMTQETHGYFAKAMERVSRMTVILTCPG